jgi:hypothetical protein
LAWFPCSAGGFDWVNYGRDKTWPAPQGWDDDGHWAGPPDPVLVSGRYSARLENAGPAAAITMIGGSDPRTGLRMSRRVELFPGRGHTGWSSPPPTSATGPRAEPC